MDTNTTVRALRPADRERVVELGARLTVGMAPWRMPAALEQAVAGWILASIDADFDGHALVAEVDGDVAGFISVSSTGHFSGERDGYIGELVVDERFEGRSVGAALVRQAETAAVEAGRRCLRLTTGAANQRAIGFYHRLGFSSEDITLTKVLDAPGTASD